MLGWNDERTEIAKKLWLDGHSASQIAKQLPDSGITRNAVIGKIHRLGLSGRATPSQPTRPAYKAPRPARPAVTAAPVQRRPVEARPAPEPESIPLPVRYKEPGTATVLTLGAHMCKWPIGDPASDEFTFCGRRQKEGGPYCVEHARIAFQPQQVKKKSSPSELARSLRRYI